MKLWMIILMIILVLILLLVLLLRNTVLKFIYPPKRTYESIMTDIKKRLDFKEDDFNKLMNTPFEEFHVTSEYGYELYGRLFLNNPQRFMILLHRESRNLIASYKFLNLYKSLGYSVVMFDARYHGRSGGNNCTYGHFEKWDLKKISDMLYRRFGEDIIVGFHGESGGAATALLNLSVDNRISFAIADSSFTDLLEVMRNLERIYLHTGSKKLLILCNMFIKRMAGYSLESVSPLTEIQALEVPVLFMHSGLDEIVPPKMSKTLKSFKSGFNDIYIAEGAPHLLGYYMRTAEYEAKVREFIGIMESNIKKYGKTYI